MTVSTLSPTTSCPTSLLTYEIESGSSTLVEAPPATSAQEATANSAVLNTGYGSAQPVSTAAAASVASPASQVSQAAPLLESSGTAVGSSGPSVQPSLEATFTSPQAPEFANAAKRQASRPRFALFLSCAFALLALL